MELANESDIYQPCVSDDGNYSDYLPPSSFFKNGLRCPCGARKDHVFDTRYNFSIHIKSKTHQKWLSDLNTNKMNYFTECEKLKELVNSQKMIIAKLERDLNLKIKTIDYLTQQLISKDANNNETDIDLIDFD